MRIPVRGSWKSLPFCCLILLAGCATSTPAVRTVAGAKPSCPPPTIPAPHPLPIPHMTADDLAARVLKPGDELLIGAGDIADCAGDQGIHSEATAKIIKKFPKTTTVFAAGDDAYKNGTKAQFEDCYEKSWGAFKDQTRPAPGNHDYGIYLFPQRNNLQPYFDYFGTRARPHGLSYYSYELGKWHIVSLDSMADQRGAPTMDDQVAWLKKDLDDTENKKCILAYWHHPLISSGDEHGDDCGDPGRNTYRLWEVLLKHGAEVVINGHDHHYERFAPQDLAFKPTWNGIRQFIVGTGGGEARRVKTPKVNSEVELDRRYGVLLMTLHPDSYDWHFINVNGNVEDLGSGECH